MLPIRSIIVGPPTPMTDATHSSIVDVPQRGDDSNESAPPPNRFQFQLRHLFVSLTAVALGCGLTTWLGPLGLVLACGPLVTWIVLNRTDGDCPWYALKLGVAVQALLVAGFLFITLILEEVLGLLRFGSWSESLVELIIVPVVAGLASGLLSIPVSIAIILLWHVLKGAHSAVSGHDDNPAP
mgnify:CR=1 FL=1